MWQQVITYRLEPGLGAMHEGFRLARQATVTVLPFLGPCTCPVGAHVLPALPSAWEAPRYQYGRSLSPQDSAELLHVLHEPVWAFILSRSFPSRDLCLCT